MTTGSGHRPKTYNNIPENIALADKRYLIQGYPECVPSIIYSFFMARVLSPKNELKLNLKIKIMLVSLIRRF